MANVRPGGDHGLKRHMWCGHQFRAQVVVMSYCLVGMALGWYDEGEYSRLPHGRASRPPSPIVTFRPVVSL